MLSATSAPGTAANIRFSASTRLRFEPTVENVWPLIHRADLKPILQSLRKLNSFASTFQCEFRVRAAERRNYVGAWAPPRRASTIANRLTRLAGITVDITDRKMAEERQMLLAEEVDHRARNVVAVVQSILRLTRADNIEDYIAAVDGRISAFQTHIGSWPVRDGKARTCANWSRKNLPRTEAGTRPGSSIDGPAVLLAPAVAQTIALALHELVTNAAKYGALSTEAGRVALTWQRLPERIDFDWIESNGPEGQTAEAARLRHTGLFGRYRVSAGRHRRFRLASGRLALQVINTAEQDPR